MKNTGSIKIIFILIILVSMVFAAIGIIYINSNSLQDASNAETFDVSTSTSGAQIAITESGFIPQILIVAKGQAVTWVNKSNIGQEITIYSLSLLNGANFSSGVILPNESFTFTLEQQEVATYKAIINGQQATGQIIVK